MSFRSHFFGSINHCGVGLLLALAALISACSTPAPPVVAKPMPLSEAAPPLVEDKGGLVLMTVTIRNDLAPDYQPQALFARLQMQTALKTKPPAQAQLLRFSILPSDRVGSAGRQVGQTYFLRFQLEPGTYRLLGLNISAGEFPVRGFGFMPIHADFTVPVGGNYYLGNLLGVNRLRRNSEFRTGPVSPKVDQSVTGFAEGTFDVSVRDFFEQDLLGYRAKFPELADRQFKPAILPPVDRQRAQEYWQAQ